FMLPARVETTADLDVQTLHGLVQLDALGHQPRAQLAGEPARGGDAELAGVGARAGGYVDDRLRARRRQLDRPQLVVELRQVGLAHPAKDDVLLDGRPHRVADISPGNLGELAHLPRRDVAERQRDRDHAIARLALLVDVAARPRIVSGRA